MLIFLLAYVIVFIVYIKSPKKVRLAITIINFFLPDPLPYVDEFLMVLGLFLKEN